MVCLHFNLTFRITLTGSVCKGRARWIFGFLQQLFSLCQNQPLDDACLVQEWESWHSYCVSDIKNGSLYNPFEATEGQ